MNNEPQHILGTMSTADSKDSGRLISSLTKKQKRNISKNVSKKKKKYNY